MSSSLQDQLLKSGLVTEDQLEQARKPRREGGAGPRGKDARRGRSRRPDDRQKQRRAEPRPPAPERPAPAPKPRDKRSLRKAVRALLAQHQLNDQEGQVPYSFVRGSRIKRIYMNEGLRRRLLAGEIVVAEVYASHYLLEPEPLTRLCELLPETFVHRADAGGDPGEEEHPIPDDLVW